jgi:hypothetical protein
LRSGKRQAGADYARLVFCCSCTACSSCQVSTLLNATASTSSRIPSCSRTAIKKLQTRSRWPAAPGACLLACNGPPLRDTNCIHSGPEAQHQCRKFWILLQRLTSCAQCPGLILRDLGALTVIRYFVGHGLLTPIPVAMKREGLLPDARVRWDSLVFHDYEDLSLHKWDLTISLGLFTSRCGQAWMKTYQNPTDAISRNYLGQYEEITTPCQFPRKQNLVPGVPVDLPAYVPKPSVAKGSAVRLGIATWECQRITTFNSIMTSEAPDS